MKTLLTLLFLLFVTSSFAQMNDSTFYAQLNKIRKSRFKKELIVDPALEKSGHAWLIKIKDNLRHDYSNYYGEVITFTNDPVDAWMNSKPHKKTILRGKYRYVGFARVGNTYIARFR